MSIGTVNTDLTKEIAGVRVVGEVPVLNAQEYSYGVFWTNFMKANKPVLLTGFTDNWRSRRDWVSEDGTPNLSFMAEKFGRSTVTVAHCGKQEFTDQMREEMSISEFIESWQRQASGRSLQSEDLLYLKDWHFFQDYPSYSAYGTPEPCTDDWLNTYLDAFQMSPGYPSSDYRFVYMGSKGTWTPLHADVFRSYSWSANVCGKKQWLLLSPDQVHLVHDRFGRNTVYDIRLKVSSEDFPRFNETRWLKCNQAAGDVLFVPSGWFHQVLNVEDTISINHNWLNACNLEWIWRLLRKDYLETVNSIEDVRSICDDFETLCQRNLAANSGMNFIDFATFVAKMVDSSFRLIADLNRYHKDEPLSLTYLSETCRSHSELRGVWINTARQGLFNLMKIKLVYEDMMEGGLFQQSQECLSQELLPVSVGFTYLDIINEMRMETDRKVIAESVVELGETWEILFILELLRMLHLKGDLPPAKGQFRGGDGSQENLGIEGEEESQRVSKGISAHPLFVLKCIDFVEQIARQVGMKTSDVQNCAVSAPATLSVQ